MAFPPSFLEELRNRVSLAQVVGRRVKLIRRGREHTGLCPFHNEKTPSFTVSEEKGFFHCFGCGAHGDVIGFVMRAGNLSFPEAVEQLARQAGLPIPEMAPGDRERAERATTIANALEAAAKWFESQLAGQSGAGPRRYLEGRGVAAETAARFRLGYAPAARTAMKEALLARGLAEPLLVEAGLLVKPEDGGAAYDRFRDRLMFPISDRRGRVIAFGGRALGDGKPKYLNSPETPLFHKGRTLYNLALAREAAREAGTVIVAEGYMDVIALAQAGFAHAVAPLGTALTEEQMEELWRLAAEPILCFDGDAAGLRAAYRAAERCLPLLKPGRSFRFALLSGGQDPDDLVRGGGAAAMAAVLEAAVPLAEMLWRMQAEGRPLDTPERRAAMEKALMDLVGAMRDTTVQGYYRRHFQERLRQAFAPAPRPGGGRPPQRGARPAGPAVPPPPPAARRERLLLAVALQHPDLAARHAEDLAGIELESRDLDSLRGAILHETSRAPGLDSAALRRHLCEHGFAELVEQLVGSDVKHLESFARPDASLAEAEAGWMHTLARQRRRGLKGEVADAGAVLAKDWSEDSLNRLKGLKRLDEAGEGVEADPVRQS
jgi:DNA primase